MSRDPVARARRRLGPCHVTPSRGLAGDSAKIGRSAAGMIAGGGPQRAPRARQRRKAWKKSPRSRFDPIRGEESLARPESIEFPASFFFFLFSQSSGRLPSPRREAEPCGSVAECVLSFFTRKIVGESICRVSGRVWCDLGDVSGPSLLLQNLSCPSLLLQNLSGPSLLL
jgi:hypothetical protein